jgi:large subunit ribosomal protein L19e
MKLTLQKKLAARVMNVGINKVRLDATRLSDIHEAITKADIKRLVGEGAIKILDKKSPSRVRAEKRHAQKKKGRQKGRGKKKGKKYSKSSRKERWITKIRPQRRVLKALKEQTKITNQVFYNLYRKAAGGFFRNRSHLLFYMKQNNLFKTLAKGSQTK